MVRMEGVESAAFMPQVVDTLHSWCTPTVLFVLLNIVIGTIAVTSRMRHNHNHPGNLTRSPSLFTRISSINLPRRSYEGEPPGTWSPPPEYAETVEGKAIPEPDVEMEEIKTSETKDVEMEEKKTSETKDVNDGGVLGRGLKQRAAPKKAGLGRSKSDSRPLLDAKPPPPPLPGKMHKYGTFEAGRKAAEPPVASGGRAPRPPPPQPAEEEESGSDAEVNAKADDFINKFKHQLKLQRLESLLRSKETLGRT